MDDADQHLRELTERMAAIEETAAKQVAINASILLVLQQLREKDKTPKSRLILPN